MVLVLVIGLPHHLQLLVHMSTVLQAVYLNNASIQLNVIIYFPVVDCGSPPTIDNGSTGVTTPGTTYQGTVTYMHL